MHDCTLLNHGSCYIYMQLCSFSKAVSCALGKVGRPRMALKDKQLMATQHVYMAKVVFVWLPETASTHVCVLTICVHTMHPLWKGRSGILSSRDLRNMALHGVAAHCNPIFNQIFSMLFLQVQLMYLMNYTENVMKLVTRVNSEYQVLLSYFFLSAWEWG